MKKGDRVKITGPACYGDGSHIGEEFEIDQVDLSRCGPALYTGEGLAWYPASSLELMDELKIGDEVEIIGPSVGGFRCCVGETFKIEREKDGCYDSKNHVFYPASSLRKISKPEYENPLKDRVAIEKDIDAHRQSHEKWRDRTIAIEQRLSEQKAANDKLRKRCHEAEQRLSSMEDFAKDTDQNLRFLGKWQMEHDLERTSRFPRGVVLAEYKKDSVTEDPVISKILDEEQMESKPLVMHFKVSLPEEPIKVGDWAEVVKSSLAGTQSEVGMILQVAEGPSVSGNVRLQNKNWRLWHDPVCLRKLSDTEIGKRLNEGRT
jgi:hypothetical protein